MANPFQHVTPTSSFTPTATTATLTLTFASPITSGNAVGVAVAWLATAGTQSITSVTDDKGNTYTINQNPGLDAFTGASQAVASCFNITNGPTVITITCASTASSNITIYGGAYEIQNSTVLDLNASGAFTNTQFVVSFSTANPNEFAVLIDLASIGSGGSFTQNNGWTQDGAANSTTSAFIFYNNLAAAGSNSLNSTPSANNHNAYSYLVFKAAPAAVLDAGSLPKPGPGISPSGRDQFHVSQRDTSGRSGSMSGRSYSVSTDYGSLIAGAALFGQSDSVSAVYGQLKGTGAMPGVSCSVSIDFGVLAQSQANVGLIPRGGPGISPASMFQFSTMILDETLLFVLSNGIVTSASTAFGRVTGLGGMSGQSYSVSTVYQIAPNGPMQGESTSASTVLGRMTAAGALTGVCDSVSMSYGNLAGVTVSQMQGISASVSLSYGLVNAVTLSQMTGMSLSVSTAYGACLPLFIERVIATQVGFYQNTRNIGDVFDVLVNDFSDDTTDYIPGQIGSPFFGWMEIVSPTTPLSANAPSPLVGPVFNGTVPQSTATTNKPRTVY